MDIKIWLKKYHLIIVYAVTIPLIMAFSSIYEKDVYRLYNQDGEIVSYSELLHLALESEITFFGELHNSAIAHWLQYELVRDAAEDASASLMIGMEMFERDQQILIDEYFAGKISQNSFENEARLWNNYKTDYKPIVEFAKSNGIALIATNIPRRYASAVYSGGLEVLDSLSTEAKKWIAPLPVEVDVELPGYKNILEAAHGHGGANLIYSQAIKDATMAHSILSTMEEGSRFIHVNGSYHSNNYEGIIWYINREKDDLKILTINTITVDDVNRVDREKLQASDITLVVSSRMTTTF